MPPACLVGSAVSCGGSIESSSLPTGQSFTNSYLSLKITLRSKLCEDILKLYFLYCETVMTVPRGPFLRLEILWDPRMLAETIVPHHRRIKISNLF